MLSKLPATWLGAASLLAVATSPGYSQNSPHPGPTSPNPPGGNPQAKPGATIVVNPTAEECQRGWNSTMKWTKDQFEDFCTKLHASK